MDSRSTGPPKEMLLSILHYWLLVGVATTMLVDTRSAVTIVREEIWNQASSRHQPQTHQWWQRMEQH